MGGSRNRLHTSQRKGQWHPHAAHTLRLLRLHTKAARPRPPTLNGKRHQRNTLTWNVPAVVESRLRRTGGWPQLALYVPPARCRAPTLPNPSICHKKRYRHDCSGMEKPESNKRRKAGSRKGGKGPRKHMSKRHEFELCRGSAAGGRPRCPIHPSAIKKVPARLQWAGEPRKQ